MDDFDFGYGVNSLQSSVDDLLNSTQMNGVLHVDAVIPWGGVNGGRMIQVGPTL